MLASLKKFAEHWLRILIVAVVLFPALIIGSHYVKKLLHGLKVDPLDQEVFHFVSLYLTVLDAVLILGTATIGVFKLLEAEVDE